MTKLEAEICDILTREGFTIFAEGDHYLLYDTLNLTFLAKRLQSFVDMERADAYTQGQEDERAESSLFRAAP